MEESEGHTVISSPTGEQSNDASAAQNDLVSGFDNVGDSSNIAPIEKKECTKFNTMLSLPKMTKLISKLTDPQKDTVTKCGFGSLLDLKCTALPNPLIFQLAKQYNPQSKSVKFEGGQFFKLNPLTIHQILGIPFGGKKVPSKASSRAKAVILKDTNQSNQAAKMEDLISMIDAKLAGDKFARIFLLITFGIFLCPTSNSRVSHHFYEALLDVKEIKNYDWSSVVVEALHKGIISFQSNSTKGNTSGKATLGVCLFSLVAAYFDYLAVDCNIIDQTIPRICIWDDKAVIKYHDAESTLEHIEIKAADSTLFTKDHAQPANFRGFYHHQTKATSKQELHNAVKSPNKDVEGQHSLNSNLPSRFNLH